VAARHRPPPWVPGRYLDTTNPRNATVTSDLMTRSMKLADLNIEETSGVDYPAHLHDGWIVMKSSDLDSVLDNLGAETNESGEGGHVDIATETTPEAVVEAPQDDLRKEVSDLRKALDDARKRNVELEETMKAREEETELAKAAERVHGWANVPGMNPTTFGNTLHSLRKVAPEIATEVEAILDATSIAMKEAGILAEVGVESAPEGDDAWNVIESKANDLVAAGTAPSFAKAVEVVAKSNPDLYNRYLNEKGL
jgi:hypothetical protein